MDLHEIAKDIRNVVEQKRQELGLQFFEDEHKYLMKDLDGNIRENFPSVSKILKHFYTPFPTEEASLKKAGGDYIEAERLMAEWAQAGKDSTNLGSRVHFYLEKELISRYGAYKDVRQPIFECDFEQILKSDSMVSAGTDFLETMKERGALLLDTELILGDDELGYTGAPDKIWLIENKDKTEIGIICTDYKTNKPKNFEASYFTKKMKFPFEKLDDTALGHYSTQLPFYCKLLLKMLKGSKYENIKVYGCIIVLVKDDGTFEEFRIPKEVQQTILEMDMKQYLTK